MRRDQVAFGADLFNVGVIQRGEGVPGGGGRRHIVQTRGRRQQADEDGSEEECDPDDGAWGERTLRILDEYGPDCKQKQRRLPTRGEIPRLAWIGPIGPRRRNARGEAACKSGRGGGDRGRSSPRPSAPPADSHGTGRQVRHMAEVSADASP